MQEYKHHFSSQAIQKQAAASVWPADCRFAHLSNKLNSVSQGLPDYVFRSETLVRAGFCDQRFRTSHSVPV